MKKSFTSFVLLSFIGLSGLFAQIPTNGLVGYWPFNGNANDLSGNNLNGSVYGATLSTDRFGNSNSAYNFNGTDSIVVNNDSLLNFTAGSSITISVWAKKTATTDLFHILGKRVACGPNFQYQIGSNAAPDGLSFGGSGNLLNSGFFLTSNQWYHIIGEFDGLKCKLYVNGAIIDSSSASLPSIVSANFIFGFSGTCTGFVGVIDDIRIYNRALNQVEITSLYNESICYQTITVTDTLIINANLTGFNPVIYASTIKIYPNPTNDHVTIDYGNYSTLSGYTIKITNSLGQTVFTSPINQQQSYVDLNTWSGNGIYFVHLIDATSNTIDIKKIVLQ